MRRSVSPDFCCGDGQAGWLWSLPVTASLDSLQLREISVDRDRRRVLDGVSVAVTRGQLTVVVGPHHCGKTSLLEAAIDAIPCLGGEVLRGGHALGGLRPRMELLCYQAAEAEPPLEVRVQTLLAASAMAERAPAALAAECEARLGLTPLRMRRAGSLTRAERQRVLLFGSLVSSKPFWLLDDPLGAFDPQARSELAPLLLQAAARGVGILWTASELLGAEALATHLCLLGAGRIVAHGTPELLRAQAGLHADASLDQVCVSLTRAASLAPPRAEVAHA